MKELHAAAVQVAPTVPVLAAATSVKYCWISADVGLGAGWGGRSKGWSAGAQKIVCTVTPPVIVGPPW